MALHPRLCESRDRELAALKAQHDAIAQVAVAAQQTREGNTVTLEKEW